MIGEQSYQAIFDKGIVGNSLDGFRNSELSTQSAKDLLNFYISEMGTLRIAKQYEKKQLIPEAKSGERIVNRLNTKYGFFIVFTQSRIITFNKTSLSKIKEINIKDGEDVLDELCNVNTFNDFVFVKDVNSDVYVFGFDKEGNIGTTNFFETIKLPFQNKQDVAMDIYKIFEYTSGSAKELRPELLTTFTKEAELSTDSSGKISLKNSELKIDRVYTQYKSTVTKDQITDAAVGLTFAVLKNYQTPTDEAKYYLDNTHFEFTGKTNDDKFGGFYFTGGTNDISGKLIFGILEDFLKDKKQIMDIVEFQSRLCVATTEKMYFSKILDYNEFVPDLTNDAAFFIKPAIIDNNQPNIFKLVSGNGLYIVCSEGIIVAAYGSTLTGLNTGNINIASNVPTTKNTALIEDVFYYVDANGILRAIVPNFDSGIIRFANLIVDKYDYTKGNIKYVCKGVINEDNVLLAIPKTESRLRVYSSLPDGLFRHFDIEFDNRYPALGYGDDIISGQSYYKLTDKNMIEAKVVLNMPFIQTEKRGIYLNDFHATYRRFVMNIFAQNKNDIIGVSVNDRPMQSLGTENFGNFNIYDLLQSISIIDTTIKIKTAQTSNTIEVRGINGFIE